MAPLPAFFAGDGVAFNAAQIRFVVEENDADATSPIFYQ